MSDKPYEPEFSAEELKEIHKVGVKGILVNYPYRQDLLIIFVSLVLSGGLTSISFAFGDLEKVIFSVLDMLFLAIPTILGFLVAGFALMFGFGDKSFLIKASRIKKNKSSYYLHIVRVFSFALFIMIASLLIMFIYQILMNIPSPFPTDILIKGHLFSLTILLFFGFYSMLLLFHSVTNVFNLTIAHHNYLYHRRKNLKENLSDTEEQ